MVLYECDCLRSNLIASSDAMLRALKTSVEPSIQAPQKSPTSGRVTPVYIGKRMDWVGLSLRDGCYRDTENINFGNQISKVQVWEIEVESNPSGPLRSH